MKPLRTLFFGTPDFSIPSLEALNGHPMIELQAVITMPDRPAGRGKHLVSPAVAAFAKEYDVPLIQTSNVNKCAEFFESYNTDNVDLIIVLAFAQFLGKKVLDLPRLGCFNIHTSLLPKYRGAAPIQYALLNGDSFTGVSIQKMVKKMDAGDVCYSRKVSIEPSESGGELYSKLKTEAALGLNEFIEDILNNKVSYSVQDETQVSFAPTISKEMGHLNFSQDSYDQILNKIRAFDPWPGTFCFINNKRLKVFSIEKVSKKNIVSDVDISQNTLLVGMGEFSIRLKDVQIEGKKRCSDIELLNGFKNSVSTLVIN